MATASSLAEVYAILRTKYFSSGEPSSLPTNMAPVCTRLTLRTGVSLTAPTAGQNVDPESVAKAISTLAELGYAI